jgi:O-antigen ligase
MAWLGMAAILALVPLFSRAHAASFIVVLLLPGAVAVALEGKRLAIAVKTAAVLVMVVLAATSFIGAVPNSAAATLVGDVIGNRRVVLWHDALELTSQAPLVGVGPGRFAEEADTARNDFDARWAHHGFLQQGAETGLIGLALLVLIFMWGFWRLLGAGPSGMAVMGAFALGALGLMACSDYVLHFPLITTVTAGLVGSGAAATSPSRPTARRRSDEAVRAEVDGSYRASPMTAGDRYTVQTGNPTGRRG